MAISSAMRGAVRRDRRRGAGPAWLVLLALGHPVPWATATDIGSDAERIGLELNRLQPTGEGACSVQLVIDNPGAHAYRSLDLDMVVFDRDGVIAARVAMQLAPLRARKLAVREFDLPELRCQDIGQLLLNDVPDCARDDGSTPDCVELLQLSSRAAAGLRR